MSIITPLDELNAFANGLNKSVPGLGDDLQVIIEKLENYYCMLPAQSRYHTIGACSLDHAEEKVM